MKNEFIPYEEALALKELGFDEPCLVTYRGGSLYASGGLSRYHDEGDWRYERNMGDGDNWVAAPLYQQAFRFFREKYNIYGYIKSEGLAVAMYEPMRSETFIAEEDSIQEAELECVREIIKEIKKRQDV